MSPGRRQAIIWTNSGISLIGPLWTNVCKIPIEIYIHSLKKKSLKMLPGNWRPICFGLSVLRWVSDGYPIIHTAHDDVIKWKPFSASLVNSPQKDQWRGALIFSLICDWINSWVNNSEAGDFRRHRAHYDAIVMRLFGEGSQPCRQQIVRLQFSVSPEYSNYHYYCCYINVLPPCVW